MARLAGKVALITGAAGGIGGATAALFAREGAELAVSDLADAAERLPAAPLQLAQDVTDEDDWGRSLEAVTDRFGRLDILVNNAGMALTKDLEDTTLEEWRRVMAVNLDSVFLGIKAAIRVMRPEPGRAGANRGGAIVNLSSVAGMVGAPMLAAYSASKGGVRLLTRSAALYCAQKGYGIRVNSVHPGFTDTEMLDGIAGALGETEAVKAKLTARQPLHRLGSAEDVAHAVLYLASDESAYVTGSELVIDGGYSA